MGLNPGMRCLWKISPGRGCDPMLPDHILDRIRKGAGSHRPGWELFSWTCFYPLASKSDNSLLIGCILYTSFAYSYFALFKRMYMGVSLVWLLTRLPGSLPMCEIESLISDRSYSDSETSCFRTNPRTCSRLQDRRPLAFPSRICRFVLSRTRELQLSAIGILTAVENLNL